MNIDLLFQQNNQNYIPCKCDRHLRVCIRDSINSILVWVSLFNNHISLFHHVYYLLESLLQKEDCPKKQTSIILWRKCIICTDPCNYYLRVHSNSRSANFLFFLMVPQRRRNQRYSFFDTRHFHLSLQLIITCKIDYLSCRNTANSSF